MRILTIVLCVLLLAACSYKIQVVCTEPVAGSPAFSLSAPWYLTLRLSPQISQITVHRVIVGAHQPSPPIWHISSHGLSLSSLTYGVVPVGFQQHIEPEPLVAGEIYEIVFSGGGGIGGEQFSVAPNNSLQARRP